MAQAAVRAKPKPRAKLSHLFIFFKFLFQNNINRSCTQSLTLSLSSLKSQPQFSASTMQLKTLARPTHTPIGAPIPRRLSRPSIFLNNQFTPRLRNSTTPPPQSIRISHKNNLRNRFLTACTSASHELIEEDKLENDNNVASVSLSSEEEEVVVEVVESKREDLANQSIWKQMKEIVMFSGPATGLWICGPLMSLISTAVIGRGSSTELAALGTLASLFLQFEVSKNTIYHIC